MNPSNFALLDRLLVNYDKVMCLKLYVNSDDLVLKKMYSSAIEKHNNKMIDNPYHIDAGFDLFTPGYDIGSPEDVLYNADNSTRYFKNISNKLDLKVCCSATMFLDSNKYYNTGYYIHPRSSLSKTQLRLANSTGIIDSSYTGNLIGMLDVVGEPQTYIVLKYDRLLQICAPGLVPIIVELVETPPAETVRGAGGFGSTGR